MKFIHKEYITFTAKENNLCKLKNYQSTLRRQVSKLKIQALKEPDVVKFVSGEYYVSDSIRKGELTLIHNLERDPISIKLSELDKDELKKLKILYPEDNSHYFV